MARICVYVHMRHMVKVASWKQKQHLSSSATLYSIKKKHATQGDIVAGWKWEYYAVMYHPVRQSAVGKPIIIAHLASSFISLHCNFLAVGPQNIHLHNEIAVARVETFSAVSLSQPFFAAPRLHFLLLVYFTNTDSLLHWALTTARKRRRSCSIVEAAAATKGA